MKTLLALLLLCASVSAATVNLAWDAADPLDQVTAWTVYEIVGTGRVALGDATAATFSVQNVTAGTHRYVVTAKNWGGESDPSNEVSVNTARPKAPKNVRVVTVTVSP